MFLSRRFSPNLLTLYFFVHFFFTVNATATPSHVLSTPVSNTTESSVTAAPVSSVSSVKSETLSISANTPSDNLSAANITSGIATSASLGSVVVVVSSTSVVSSFMPSSKPLPSVPPVIVPSSTSTPTVSRSEHNAPAPPPTPTQIFQATSGMPSSTTPISSSSPKSEPTSTSRGTASVPPTGTTKENVITTASPSHSVTNLPAPPPPPPTSSSSSHASVTVSPSGSTARAHESSSPVNSVVTSVTVVHAPLSHQTMTVTASVTTTFSSPVLSTSTAANGAIIITTPALITVMSTSTEPDGALTTITQIVANPPNFSTNEALSRNSSGLSHRPGVLAGICVVAGLVAAAIIIGAVYCVRRNRRISRRRRWLAGMQRQRPQSLPGDPFRDPVAVTKEGPYTDHAGPVMQTVDLNRHDRWDQLSSVGGSQLSHAQGSPKPYEPRNLFTLYPDPHPQMQPVRFSGSSSENHQMENIGIAYSTNNNLAVPAPQFKRHSLTPSSPSIYPASLPAEDEDDFHAQELRNPENTIPVLRPEIPSRSPARLSSTAIPPRPPRSHLRESAKAQTLENYNPLTPPASETSSKPPSPISEARPQDVLHRRTLLDVRSRSISDRP